MTISSTSMSSPVGKQDNFSLPWGLLSQNRGALMGVAMLIVMLFHVPLSRHDAFYGLMRCGNNGVDMFLFLSGIGLWYSWTKSTALPFKTQTLRFFWRRYIRIYPAWLIAASLFYIPDYLAGTGVQRSPDVFNLVLNILVGWSFWRMDDLTFWFVPSIMMLYSFAPFYMKLIQRYSVCRWMPLLFVLWYALVRYYPPLWQSVGYVEIFWSRIPVFLLGINAGQWVKASANATNSLDKGVLVVSIATFALSLFLCVYIEGHRSGAFPPFTERMAYIPLAVSGMLLYCFLFWYFPKWLLRFFSFVGGISLELYLVHVNFVLKYIKAYHLGYWPTFLVMLAISIPLAWLLSKLVSSLIKPLPKTL